MPTEQPFVSKENMPEEVFAKRMFGSSRRIRDLKAPFMIFGPVAGLLLVYCVVHPGLGIARILLGLLGAVGFWTAYEYLLHRFFFHMTPRRKFTRKLLYTLHQAHHDYPNDKRLMLLEPQVSFSGFLVFYGLFYLVLGHPDVHVFMLGMILCYLAYEWLHFAVHNYDFRSPLFQYYKRHHLQHHYLDNRRNYGFITAAWDRLFGTKIEKENQS